MTIFFIALGLFVAAVVWMGIRYDRRQRALGAGAGVRSRGHSRIEAQTKADEWGGPGY